MANQPDCCSPLVVAPISAEDAVDCAPLFRALGDPVRLRLFSIIASYEGGEVCVCDLSGTFDLSGPTISHHLKTLKEAGLVESERRGTWVYYRVRSETVSRLAALTDAPEPARV